MSQLIKRNDYDDISANDPNTDVTGAELEELTDGSESTLHSHAGGGGASQLSDLSDVNTSTPTNRNALLADGVDWESRAIVEADISDLGTYSTATGVEDNADVTDTANVTAAGALMDSEVTNLSQVKAFDSSDYATAAQGTLADSALQDITAEPIADLSNVTITTPADNEVLSYNSGTTTWINQTASEAGLATAAQGALADTALQDITGEALTNLSDVDTDKTKTPADGDILTYDGTDWNAETPASGGDVSSTAAITDNTIVRGDGGSKNVQDTGITIDDNDAIADATINDFSNEVEADTIHVQVRNQTGSTLTKGTPVYISGYNIGVDVVEVSAADASSVATSDVIGVVEADIANASTGAVDRVGRIFDIDTSSFSVGDILYLSETAGQLTATQPTGTAQVVEIGEVLRSHASLGIISVSISRTNKTGFATTLLDDATAAAARTTLDVDQAGTDNSTDVTLAGTGTYLSIAGQQITQDPITESDISDLNHTVDVVSNVATSTVLGRTTAGSGDSEELTAAQVRTLINVEDGADVTDTTNVTAAGALMDSEVTNLAQVKAFSSSDYATAAQGATADSALQDITGESLTDLSDVDTDKSKTPADGDVLTFDGTDWNAEAAASGSGDVVGPASSTDNAVPRFDGTTGKLLQDSTMTINDGGGVEITDNLDVVAILSTNTINEYNAGSGVTVDSVLIKDGEVDGNDMTAVDISQTVSPDNTTIQGTAESLTLASNDLGIILDPGLGNVGLSGANITNVGTVDGEDVSTVAATANSALQDVVDDTTPTLGGTLDANNNIISNVSTLGADFIDLNGNANSLILDADGDTIIDAATDDTIDFQTGGVDRMSITNAGVSLQSGQTISSFGTLAEQNSVNNGDWSGTDLSVANGGTGASTASAALSNLGGIGAATTDTLTNKTIDADNNTITDLGVDEGVEKTVLAVEKTSNFGFTSSATITSWSTADVTDSDVSFNTSTGVATINTAGVYEVIASVSARASAGSDRSTGRTRIMKNGSVIGGSHYLYIRQSGHGSTSSHNIAKSYSASDTIDIEVERLSGTSTCEVNAANLTIRRIS